MTANPTPIRVALLGYGFAGRIYHAPLIQAVPGLALTVVGSSRPDSVHADIPAALICSPTEAATHPDVDLVVIATPNSSHHPLAAAALRAGKHVVVDKPFTVTLTEARSLAEIAAQHNRLLSVFHNRRWETEVLATKDILASGSLGEVVHYECHMDRYRPNVRQRWREDPGPGAGLWFDLGPHLIDQALYLFGLPDSVNASFAILRPGGRTDDWAHVQLNYPRLHVILHTTLLAVAPGPRSTLHGTLATWTKHGPDPQEPQLIAGLRPGDPAYGIDPDPGILTDGATRTVTTIPAPPGNQSLYYAAIRDAILTGQPPPIPARDAVAVMAILETSFQSGATGQTLPIPLTPTERAQWL